MLWNIKRAAALLVASIAIAFAVPVAPAGAHGETAQEAFLRMGTVAFWDVHYSTSHVKQEELLKITGTAKILETWPEQLAEPKLGFIGVVAPGPVVVVKERLINGQPAPMAIEVEKGGVYHFELTLAGRRPGRWHVHPIFGIHGAGSLLGPGQYIDVQEKPGGFTNDITLVSGKTKDLETLGVKSLAFWNVLWFVVGLIWLLYWIVPKPTVTRLPVTSQIPLNTDGEAYGLITKKDHRAMNAVMGLTLALVVGGMVWQAHAYPVKMPQQVLRFAPQAAEMDANFVDVEAVDAVFQVDSDTVVITVNATNLGKTPMSVTQFTTSTLTFPVAAKAGQGRSLQVSPSAEIAPGETATLKLSMSDAVWAKERLMPVGESRMQVTGVMRFADAGGHQNFKTVQSFVKPSRIG
jgi:methane/ammonia monooxygenase subunit B